MPVTFNTAPIDPEIPPGYIWLRSDHWNYFGFTARGHILTRLCFGYDSRTNLLKSLGLPEKGCQLNRRLLPDFQQQLICYGNGRPETDFDCTVDISSFTPFGQSILKACATIPSGKTLTYAQLARRAHHSNAFRAAGSVLASNPFQIIIPCHRVICGSGNLGGYSAGGGSALKRDLIQYELFCLKENTR